MRMMRRLEADNKGDTIVEVLISIAVIGIVLGGAFVSANRSLKGTQLSKDRAEATGIVRGQLEILMDRLTDPSATSSQKPAEGASSRCYSDLSSLNIGSSCTFGTNSQYTVSITRGSGIGGQYKYEVEATWANSLGVANGNKITMNYNASR